MQFISIQFNSIQISKVNRVQIGLKLNLNSIRFKFNLSKIKYKIDTQVSENMLAIFLICDYGVGKKKKKKTMKKHNLKKTPFHSIHNKFQIKTYFVKMG